MVNENKLKDVIDFIKDTLDKNSDTSIIVNKFHLEYSEDLKEIVYILNLASPHNEELEQKGKTILLDTILNSHKKMTDGEAIDFITKNLENKKEFLFMLEKGYNIFLKKEEIKNSCDNDLIKKTNK